MERNSGFLLRCLQEHKAIDRQDVTGAETLPAPLLELVPDVAALVYSEKTLITPTDRSDRGKR